MDELEFRDSSLSISDVAKIAGIVAAAYVAVAINGLPMIVAVACLAVGYLAGILMRR